jgi:hypothetical protein
LKPVNIDVKLAKSKLTLSDLIIYLVIAFLIAKFLGLTKTFLHIDPPDLYGFDLNNLQWVWAPLAIGLGVVYKELRDIRKSLVNQGERIARLEGKIE